MASGWALAGVGRCGVDADAMGWTVANRLEAWQGVEGSGCVKKFALSIGALLRRCEAT